MGEKNVSIKYDNNGIFIHFNPVAFHVLYEELEKTLLHADGFFKDAQFRGIEGVTLEESEREKIISLLSQHNIAVDEKTPVSPQDSEMEGAEGLYFGESRLFFQTVRSGQTIHSKQSVILIGDLNAGGEVHSEGNVIILGNARGRIHAGKHNHPEAYVMGYQFENARILIHDLISEEVIHSDRKQMICFSIKEGSIQQKEL